MLRIMRKAQVSTYDDKSTIASPIRISDITRKHAIYNVGNNEN